MIDVSKIEDDFDAESLFAKLYPEYCCRGRPMHPYIDIFKVGVECAFNEIEVKIKEKEL